ncbi:hypothetical protein [Gordonia aichiensis]|uniref:hypothetical protein n=1 Tax=Gordonia aichiensis TaxID=36820 RepID=UPI003264DB4B
MARRRLPRGGRAVVAGALLVTVAVLAAASAVAISGAEPAPALAASSIDTVVEPGVPDAVLVSRTLFASSPSAVVVAAVADPADQKSAADLARSGGVPMFRVDAAIADRIGAELDRLGVEQAVRVGPPTVELNVPVTTDRVAVAGGASSTGRGAVILLSGDRTDAVATAEAAGAHGVSMPAPDPRSSGEAVRLLAELPGAPIRGIGAGFGTAADLAEQVAAARTVPELPGGGQLLFPGRRVVALYGSPGAPELGPLGRASIPATIARTRALADKYRRLSPVPVVPGFEIIVTVASADPGPGGKYTSALDVATVRPWVDAARRAGVYVTLDLQPGRMDFLTQAKMYRELLLQPHVGLALDPEWRLKPGQKHLEQIGAVEPAEVNRVSTWLADLVKARKLPQKALVLHQFDADMLGDRSLLDTRRPELAFLIHADGHGVPAVKMETWNRIVTGLPPRTWLGWKNFYTEDKPMFSPRRTMAVEPVPWFVSYQ